MDNAGARMADTKLLEAVLSDKGWYCIMKGDNNPEPDPGRVRFSQLRRVVVAIIY